MHIHVLRFLPFALFSACMLWFLIKKWDFVSGALSDSGTPSATRTGGFIFVLVVAFNEVFTTMKTMEFKYDHLIAILITIGCCWGLVKAVDIMSIMKNGKTTTNDNQPQ